MSRAARIISLALLALVVAGAAMASPPDGKDRGPKRGRRAIVQWSPELIRASVDRGSTYTYTASFTSNVDLQNVALWVNPSLSRFATLDISNFAAVAANAPCTIHITLTVPPAPADSLLEARDSFNGLVQMRAAGQHLPSALNLRFHVFEIAPTVEDPAAGGQ